MAKFKTDFPDLLEILKTYINHGHHEMSWGGPRLQITVRDDSQQAIIGQSNFPDFNLTDVESEGEYQISNHTQLLTNMFKDDDHMVVDVPSHAGENSGMPSPQGM